MAYRQPEETEADYYNREIGALNERIESLKAQNEELRIDKKLPYFVYGLICVLFTGVISIPLYKVAEHEKELRLNYTITPTTADKCTDVAKHLESGERFQCPVGSHLELQRGDIAVCTCGKSTDKSNTPAVF